MKPVARRRGIAAQEGGISQLINMYREKNTNEDKKGKTLAEIIQEKMDDEEEKKALNQDNFIFGKRRYHFAKVSLYVFKETNPFRRFLAKIITHP